MNTATTDALQALLDRHLALFAGHSINIESEPTVIEARAVLAQAKARADKAAASLRRMRADILTNGGYYFDFLRPQSSRYTVEVVAHHLSHIGRFTGATNQLYTVAQHAVLV